MAYTLTQIKAQIAQELQDTGKVIWSDPEIEDAVNDALRELALYVPNIVKGTLTTTANSKDLDISSIADLIYVSEVEYEVGKDPRRWRNFTIRGNTLTIEIDFAPSAGQSVYLYCAKPHILTDASSTLSPELERIIVSLASARLAVSKGASLLNEATNAISILTNVETEIGNMTNRIQRAIDDLTAGRLLINKINVGGSPEDDYARYASGELNNAGAYLNKARGHMMEITSKLNLNRSWQNYQTWGERKLAIVLSELKRLVKPKIGRLYATDR